jgi:uncharacterized protein with NRDE domain
MCMLAILYRVARNTPVLLAANREESFARPTQYPKIQPGTPRVVCGIDRQAGGTWLGVNQFGLAVAVMNRRKLPPLEPRSRGLLCRELLDLRNAREASERAAQELASGRYAGANYLCVDGKFGAVIYGGNRIETVEITPGLHIVGPTGMDDPRDERQAMVRRMLTLHTLDSAVTFLAVASRAFSRKADAEGRRGMVLSNGDYGTVSSTLLSLARKSQQSTYQYCPGSPAEVPYDDLSALLRQVLSANRARAKADAAKKDGAKDAGKKAKSKSAK